MKKALYGVLLATGIIGTNAQAETPSFTMIEAGYEEIGESDGLGVRGSVEITDLIYFTGSYSDLSAEDTFFGSRLEADSQWYSGGLGLKFPVGKNSALFTEAVYQYVDTDFTINGVAEEEVSPSNGFELSGGIRSMLADNFELYGKLSHVDLEDEATTILTGGLRVYFTENFGLNAEIGRNDFDNDLYFVGATLKF